MKVAAAYLLARLGGNDNPSVDYLKKILESVGVEADTSRIELLLSDLKDKDFTEVIASGREKLASVPSAGAASVAAPSAGGAAAPSAKEEKKEEKKVEVEESDDEDLGPSLFDLEDDY